MMRGGLEKEGHHYGFASHELRRPKNVGHP